MSYLFAPAAFPSIEIVGRTERFAVHRIYCVGRNYAAHAREMGHDQREPPFFFMKPADAVVPNRATIPFPSRTSNLHHEVELVAALQSGGRNIQAHEAQRHVFGYAVGNDLTRRDLQSEARDKSRPWDTAKGFDRSAVVGNIHPIEKTGPLENGRIWLNVNGEPRQQGDLSELIWNVPEIIAELSTYFELAAGDLIFTGTPSGVGPLKPGDRIDSGIEGLDTVVTILGTEII
ncbi:MAG TPA: fumarylacetoacetate hydrolase family protein [Steroidobacteraceae bacterium]|nr:fumarylacetoacetate hydrolase family protein [Steroidobacteraceae bacterium]